MSHKSPKQSLFLLGKFELSDPAGAVVLPAGKPLAVLAYLACAPHQRVSRGTMIDLLWGTGEPERARSSLRQVLFTLRRILGSDAFETDGDMIRLHTRLTVDSVEFTGAMQKGDTARAIAHYAGDFIPHFATPGSADFERWIDVERFRLRSAFLTAARLQLRALMDAGSISEAVALSGRLRDTDPDDDQHWRFRIEALALAGRFALIDLEESELRAARASDDRAVDAATESLLRRLRRSAASAGSESHTDATAEVLRAKRLLEPEFQGRSVAFARLLNAWGLATRKQAQLLTITAPAGMGKTRLLAELGNRLRAKKSKVVYVNARQRERDDAYSFLAELVSRIATLPGNAGIAPASAAVLAGLVPTLADRFNVRPENSGGDAADILRRRSLAVADLMGAVADESPVAIFVDDLQWADTPSLEALERAFSRILHEPVLVVAASREPSMAALAEHESLALTPLSIDEVASLIGSIAIAEAPAWSAALTWRVHDATAGAPFAILQFLRLGLEHFALHIAGDTWEVPDPAVVLELLDRTAAIGWRVRSLDAADLEVLTYLAIAGDPISELALAAASGSAIEKLRAALFRLEADAFVARGDGHTWRIAHDLVSEGVIAATTDALRSHVASRVGLTLAPDATDVKTLRHVVRLLLDGNQADAAFGMVSTWFATLPRRGSAGTEVETAILGPNSAHTEFAARLRRMTRRRQLLWRSRSVAGRGLAVATLVVAAAIVLRPVSLAQVGQLSPTEASRWMTTYEVEPQVEVRSILGVRTRWRDGDSIHIAPADSGGELEGHTYAVVHDGVAVFDSTYPSNRTGQLTTEVRFTLRGLPPLVLRNPQMRDSLVILDAVFGGKQLYGETPELQVHAGDPIEGFVRLRYATHARDLLYTLAQTMSWGIPSKASVTVRTLLAGITGARIVTPVALTAPPRPGTYWLLWTQGAEPDGKWLLSGTNWQCGKPNWHDGNELATLPQAMLAAAVLRHEIWIPYLYCPAQGGGMATRRLTLAGVRVVVTDRGK